MFHEIRSGNQGVVLAIFKAEQKWVGIMATANLGYILKVTDSEDTVRSQLAEAIQDTIRFLKSIRDVGFELTYGIYKDWLGEILKEVKDSGE